MDKIDIYNEDFFEGSRLYELNSRLHQKIGAKVKEIFARLFRGTDVNLDNFYFTGFDSEEPNAFKVGNVADKTIIAVSYGLIKAVERTEEFAAVIAHECGHAIWAELIGGDNTIIQERSADIHSVDMMLNAGYNPRYVTVMQKKVFSDYSNSEVTFDVHGSNFQRIEDVKAYMTKLASERGDFPDITEDKPDTEWIRFKSEIEKIRNEDGYDTFLDKELKKKFGEKDITKINRFSVLKFFLECINKNPDWFRSEHRARLQDLGSKLKQYIFTTKTEEETLVLQDIFISLYTNVSSSRLEISHDLLQHFNLDIFGPFQEQYENIENLIKYCYDKDKAIEYAKKIKDLLWTASYVKNLRFTDREYPAFEPLGKDNVGKRLPWDQLASYNDPNIKEILRYVCPNPNSWTGGNEYSRIKGYKKEDYFLDDRRIVIAYGEEAHKLHDKAARQRVESDLYEQVNNVGRYVEIIDVFYKYAKDEISLEEWEKSLKKFGEITRTFIKSFNPYEEMLRINHQTIHEVKEYGIDYTCLRNLYEKIKQTDFYKHLIQTSPEFEFSSDYLYEENLIYLFQRISITLNPANFSVFNKVIMNGLLKNADEISKNDEKMGSYEYERLMRIKARSTTFSADNIVKSEYRDTEFKKNLDENLVKAHREIEKYNADFKYKIMDHAIKNIEFVCDFSSYLESEVIDGLKSEKESKIIADMMKTLGILHMPKDAHALKLSLQTIQNIQRDLFTNRPSLMLVLWTEYLKNGYMCNPIELLSFFKDLKRLGSSYDKGGFYKYSQDIIGKNITIKEFQSFNLMDKLKLYEFMDTKDLFSEKLANKNSFIKIITDEILKYPDKEFAIKDIVLQILTRHPVTEYGELAERDIEFANEREKLIDFYAKHWAKKLGRDDGSDEYLQRVKKFTDFVSSMETVYNKDWRGEEKRLFSQMVAQNLLNKVSDAVIAQERAAKMFANAGKLRVDADNVNNYDWYGRGAEAVFGVLADRPEKALRTIRFLNEKLTGESVDNFLTDMTNESGYISDKVNKQSLIMIHENFWSADLPIRAYVMNRLLNAYTTKDDKKLALVVDTYFKKDSEYYKDAIIVLESAYKNLQDYERGLILSALLSSGQNEDDSSITNGQQVGRGLKRFFQTKGGAFVKFGQLLSYLPSLDSDIRKELATLREKANIPTRDELFEMLKTSLPEAEFNKISYVGKILGGGSIYVSVHVKYDGKDCVIAVMRPNTRELMSGGINMISESVNDMADKDKKFAALKNIVTQAKTSCESEIDIEQDYDKYYKAVKIYESLVVHTPNADYSPYVARWIKYGADENKNNAYKIMEMAMGESLTSDDIEEQEKHDMAMAYVALELSILLSGATWDTDRHMGQQNFYNKSFRDFCIGIFDTGAQMNNEPGVKDKVMLGHLLYELIRGARGGKDISNILNSKVKFLDSIGKKIGVDTVYIDGVQRGLIALSDIIEYQKEIKDDDGNIIHERKTLTESDLQNIMVALMDSGLIDKTVMKTIRAKAILNKLRVLRPGWFKTLSEGFTENTSNITIQYTGKKPEISHIGILNKAKAEIERLMALRESEKHLGIDKDLIIHSDDSSGRM